MYGDNVAQQTNFKLAQNFKKVWLLNCELAQAYAPHEDAIPKM